ncbi:MAG: alpha-2-macroglobulin family protein [Ignavibacteriales bacterium]|nr:alpha-2-macroglobulin family protein [Ignavibacteriales bacterium]
MNRIISKIVILLTALFYFACGPSNTVEVEEFTPSGVVDKLTTFTIVFTEDLAPLEVIEQWSTEEYVIFEPKIVGKFKWLDARTLIFSPEFPLEPIQQYSAEITKKVLFDSGKDPDFDTYKFNTPDFNVVKIDYFWTQIPHENYKMSIQANIYFNYPVLPDQLKKYLKVEVDGDDIEDYQIITKESSEVIAINLGDIQQTDKKQEIQITIKNGLQSVVGKQDLGENKEFDYDLPQITKLEITGIASGFDGVSGWIDVYTTQMVDEKELNKYVKTEPSKTLKYFVSEDKFRVEGDFFDAQTVDLIIKKGLPGLYGGELEDEFVQMVSMVNLAPSINFTDTKGKYLMYSGSKIITANVVNINEIELEVSQVFKNNILFFLSRYDYYYYDDYYYDYYSPDYSVDNYGKLLYTEKIQLKSRTNWLEQVNVNLDKALENKFKGIYVVNVSSAEDRWLNASKMVAISDLGIITKKGEDEIVVFVNSIKTAEPVSGVDISIISSNNQTILSDVTNSDGIVHFKKVKEKIEGFTPRLVFAEKGGDFNYIDLNETFIETSRYDVGGIHEYSSDVMCFIYSDRNLYRPGDRVNVSAIVRDENIQILKDRPIIVKIITPAGKVYDEFKKHLNAQGSFELSFDMPDYVQTGEYTVELYSGTETIIGAYKFSIEDFVPDKIRVTLTNDKKTAKPGETVPINIDAEFLFGAKASDLKYQADIQLRHRIFSSKTFPDFDFSNSSIVNPSYSNYFVDGKLDENGKSRIDYIIPADIYGSGIITGYAYISVFDLTGRTVNRVAAFDIYPKDYFIGIKSPGYYFGTNEDIKFQFAAVGQNDKPINNFSAKVELVRYEWKTVLKRDYSNRYYYASERKEIREWTKNIKLSNSKTDFPLRLEKSGNYEIRVYKTGSSDYQKFSFYAYGWTSTTASSFEVDKEGRIDIVFDKEVYEPGDKAKVLFMCPFSGKLLVTIERNGVLEHQYVEVKDKSIELKLSVDSKYMPNVYVTATLFKKHNADANTPFLVGHGFASMKVEKKSNRLPVTINAPTKIKPNTRQSITIKTVSEKDVYVTLAAVDEGILQIKDFQTPDPYKYMYAKRQLKVSSYDLYKLLLPEILSSSTGGDEMISELKKRTNPIPTKRYKLVSIWSGIRRTNSDGTVTINLDIPQFNGDLRLMAIAYSGPRFGSAEEHIKVADDLIIEPEVPRVLSIDDELISPVTVINTTSKKGEVKVNIKVEGPLTIVGPTTKSVTVNPNSTEKVTFTIKSKSEVGKGKITIETSGIAKVKEEIDIAVRPVSPLISETGSGVIKAGTSANINIPKNYLEGTQNTALTISKFPAIKFAEHLKYLIGYPHGCIEQTVSQLFPQLYFDELAKLVAPDIYRTNSPVYYIKEGIRKIESMQLYDGSMAYWQGGYYGSWWGSVYAAHFLIEAQKVGYDVKKDVLNKLLNYIAKRAKEQSTYDYITYANNQRIIRKIANKEILYSLYVLALAGKGDIATMNYYKARLHLLSEDSKYLLAGAYAMMGKWSSYNSLIPSKFTPEKTDRLTGGNFDSGIRSNAIMLNVLIEVDPNNKQIPNLIKHLSNDLKNAYSTQERSFIFLALGKSAKRTSDANMKVYVNVNGSVIETYNGKDITTSNSKLNGANVTLKSEGTGELYYFWNTEGVKVGEKIKEVDSFIRIRRAYYDYRTKQQITNNKFTQGQLIVCKITLSSLGSSAENIVITDMIPAAFEIENPRLSTSTELTWKSDNPLNPQYTDIRDDRIILFTDINFNSTKDYYYMLRVVNQGKFQLPVIGAEAMYDREFHSFNGAGVIEVK